jgi:DNA-binding response OmpR family regulator
LRILVTEDDSTLAEALQFSLTQSGYAVDWVANGAAADEALKGSGVADRAALRPPSSTAGWDSIRSAAR